MSLHTVNVHEAKTQLSKLLEAVQSGAEVVIAKSGTPIARLVPYVPPKRKITPPGAMKGQIWIDDDFDEPLDELFACLDDKPAATE
jgi:prevent-host-death family protein